MKKTRNMFVNPLLLLLFAVLLLAPSALVPNIESVIVFARIPAAGKPSTPPTLDRTPMDRYVDGCEIVRLDLSEPGASVVSLTHEFHSALDPAVSFDGRNILFAAKRKKEDLWQIWQMDPYGENKKQVTQGSIDAVSPLYIGSLFHLDDRAPTRKIAYVGGGHLYTCSLDGSDPRRITFNTATEFSPDVLPNGRIIYSTTSGGGEHLDLLSVNIDGTDHMGYLTQFCVPGDKEMVRIGGNGRIYFIHTDVTQWLGGGSLADVDARRPAHSYRLLASAQRGFYHSPCPLLGGGLAVSYRAANENSLYSIYRMEPGKAEQKKLLYRAAGYHCVDTQILAAHKVVKGRSSFVDHTLETGVLYCINVYISRETGLNRLPFGSIKSVQVVLACEKDRRILGSAPVEPDGSFHIRVPANTPLTFRLIDKNGREVSRQLSRTWVMPRESRGCIGCHEDSELAPPNRLPKALLKPAVTIPMVSDTTREKQR